MNWLVLLIAVVWAVALAAVPPTAAAIVLSTIPSAALRKWLVILAALAAGTMACLVATYGFYFPEDVAEIAGEIQEKYAVLPTTTILFTATIGAFLVGLAAITIWGFLPQPEPPYQPRAAAWSLRRQGKWLGTILGMAILAVLVQDLELRRRLRRLEAQALKTAESMSAKPVPEDQNAAVYYQQIADMKSDIEKLDDDPKYEDAFDGLTLCACESDVRQEFFDRQQPVRQLLEQAAKRTQCQFVDSYQPLDVLDGMNTSFALVAAARRMTQYAQLMACRQKPREAIAALQTVRALENRLRADPRNGDMVFYFWFEGWIRRAISNLVTHCDSLPVDELKGLLAEPVDFEKYHRDVLAWRAALAQIHLAKTFDGRNYLRNEFRDQSFDSPSRRAALCFFMRFHLARDEMQAIEARYPFLARPADPAAWEDVDLELVFPRGQLTSSVDSLSTRRYWADQGNTNRQLANIAIAAGLYHQQHGQWPAAIANLVPDYLPRELTDPETGGPFQWKPVENGLIVYSEFDNGMWQQFDGSHDAWWSAAERCRLTMFLGEAYRQVETAAVADMKRLCPEDRKREAQERLEQFNEGELSGGFMEGGLLQEEESSTERSEDGAGPIEP